MKTRMIAIAASAAALSFATLPLAQAAAATPHERSGIELKVDRSKDRLHADKSSDVRDTSISRDHHDH